MKNPDRPDLQPDSLPQGEIAHGAMSLFDWAESQSRLRRNRAGPEAVGARVYTLYPPAGAGAAAVAALSSPDADWPEVPRDFEEEDQLISLFDSDDLITAEQAASELRRSIERMQTEDRKAANEAELLLDGLARMLAIERERLDERARDLDPPLVFDESKLA